MRYAIAAICALLLSLLLVTGCAELRGTVRGLLQCAPGEYAAVDNAIRSGGIAWLGPVLGALQCVPQVTAAIEEERARDARNAPPGTLDERLALRERINVARQLHAERPK